MSSTIQENPSSFRDPSGSVFEYQGEVYRNINKAYVEQYEFLINSGLLKKLFGSDLLVKHEQVNNISTNYPESALVIKPERLPLISYPYEWSFSQLKDAALLTLQVLRLSLEHGMILKDASAFNVQFKGFHPVFIDTLSFEKYEEGQVWKGYKQFCEHFLAPLCLSSTLGVWFQSLLKTGLEGIPLKITSKLLPFSSWFNPAILFHIHLHAKSIDLHTADSASTAGKVRKITKNSLIAMVDNLQSFVGKLMLNKSDKTQWQDYDKEVHYSAQGKQNKASIVEGFMATINPSVIWDMGANDGYYSRILTSADRIVISMDADPRAVEKNFNYIKREKVSTVYPLLFDVTNPSPDLGWANRERTNLSLRSKPDLIVALALIHHIVITNNVPFKKLADYFAGLAEWLVIEYVPQDDEKIKFLPQTAGKSLYNRSNFEKAFFSVFDLISEKQVQDSQRSILLLKKK